MPDMDWLSELEAKIGHWLPSEYGGLVRENLTEEEGRQLIAAVRLAIDQLAAVEHYRPDEARMAEAARWGLARLRSGDAED